MAHICSPADDVVLESAWESATADVASGDRYGCYLCLQHDEIAEIARYLCQHQRPQVPPFSKHEI